MLYICIKILHIVSAALLLASMVYCYRVWRLRASMVSERIQTQTWAFIIPFALFQLVTGFTMISLQHYDFSETWVSGSVIGFIVVIISWFAFIYFLLSDENSAKLRRLQFAMLFICTLSLLSMVFFMANRVT